MFSSLFPVFTAIDGWMAFILPLIVRICLWGVVAGFLGMLLYLLASNQSAIANLKSEARSLRKKMLDPSLDHVAFSNLMKTNLKVSLVLLSRVIGPALLSAVPVLLVAMWMSTYFTFDLPESGKSIILKVFPKQESVWIKPPHLVTNKSEGFLMINPAFGDRFIVGIGNKQIYAGNPFSPPTPYILKKRWWHILVASEAGYISNDSPVDELRFDFPSKVLIGALPDWASGWELVFFIAVFVSALAIKFIFRIE